MTHNITPPPTISQLSIVVKAKNLYSQMYQLRFSIDKKHRFGIHTQLEEQSITFLTLLIEAALTKDKILILQKCRIVIETIRHLVRLEHELEIIPIKKYLAIAELVEELAKMTAGWYKSAQ